MNNEINPRRRHGDGLGFNKMSVATARAGSTEGRLLTSRQSAFYFPAEDFKSGQIFTEPTISCREQVLPLPVSMIRFARFEGTGMAVAEPLISGLLMGGLGAVLTLKELAREADAARRER